MRKLIPCLLAALICLPGMAAPEAGPRRRRGICAEPQPAHSPPLQPLEPCAQAVDAERKSAAAGASGWSRILPRP